MFTTSQLQEEILRVKKEKNICILAHAYQSQDIWEVADYVGDSYGLSVQAARSDADTIIMCGVRFMAETVKILSPDKKVILSHPDAGCPMASQMGREDVLELKERYPDYTVVAYINTTAELKTVCDVCVTSSAAVRVVQNLESSKILFIPDQNLGQWVSSQIPEKEFVFFHGGCPTHTRVSEAAARETIKKHPDALVLVHPECLPGVTAMADYVGSTTGIMDYAKKSDAKEFIIGTENSIVQHLQFACPEKTFHPLSKICICPNMKMTTLGEVWRCENGIGGEEIVLDEEVRLGARRCISRMLELGN